MCNVDMNSTAMYTTHKLAEGSYVLGIHNPQSTHAMSDNKSLNLNISKAGTIAQSMTGWESK